MTTNTEPHHVDAHGLLASGEPLATAPELAKTIGCSARVLRELLRGPLADRVRRVEYYNPGPWRYAVADALEAVKPHLAWIEERRQRGIEHEAAERAAREAKKTAAPAPKPASAPKAKVSKPATRAPGPVATSSRGTSGPEVFITRRSARP
jgi:hypothetical protein